MQKKPEEPPCHLPEGPQKSFQLILRLESLGRSASARMAATT